MFTISTCHPDADIMSAEDCWLYEKEANVEKAAEGVDVDGIQWGDIQCYNMDGCSVSAETSCVNKIMSKFTFALLSQSHR